MFIRPLEDWIGALLVGISAFLIASVSSCDVAHAEPNYDQLADAIKKVEGVPYYGIKSVHWDSYAEARLICKRTCRHAWRDYMATMPFKTQNKPILGDYLDFLGDRYCPAKVDKAGNVNWKANIKRIYKGGI